MERMEWGGIPIGSSHFIFVTISTCVLTAPGEKSGLVWHLEEKRRSPTIQAQSAGGQRQSTQGPGGSGGRVLAELLLPVFEVLTHSDLRSGVYTKSLPFLQDTSTCTRPSKCHVLFGSNCSRCCPCASSISSCPSIVSMHLSSRSFAPNIQLLNI